MQLWNLVREKIIEGIHQQHVVTSEYLSQQPHTKYDGKFTDDEFLKKQHQSRLSSQIGMPQMTHLVMQNEYYGGGNPELRHTRSERGLPIRDTASFPYQKFHDEHMGEADEYEGDEAD